MVFVLRVGSPSFPRHYREDLVEFPAELRDPDTMPEGDAQGVCTRQEERRLFYVAITRAEDQLVLCGKKGTGKTDPLRPAICAIS